MKYKIIYEFENGILHPEEYWNGRLFCSVKAAEKAFSKVHNQTTKEYNDYLLSLGFRLFKITICQELK
jgi:hypothetical protein